MVTETYAPTKKTAMSMAELVMLRHMVGNRLILRRVDEIKDKELVHKQNDQCVHEKVIRTRYPHNIHQLHQGVLKADLFSEDGAGCQHLRGHVGRRHRKS